MLDFLNSNTRKIVLSKLRSIFLRWDEAGRWVEVEMNTAHKCMEYIILNEIQLLEAQIERAFRNKS